MRRRNYSFLHSKILSEEKMTEVNGIIIPFLPGSNSHVVLCALAEYKDHVLSWERIYTLSEKFMRQYGGQEAWEKFYNQKDARKRIRLNVYKLTRSGKECLGYRLHERGMCIYGFSDGAMLCTGGELIKSGSKYDVKFPDGRTLQKRHKGKQTLTSKEYAKFVEMKIIDASCNVLNEKKVIEERKKSVLKDMPVLNLAKSKKSEDYMEVCISLSDDYNQVMALRFDKMGIIVEQTLKDQLIARVPISVLAKLNEDRDVVDLEVLN